MIEGKTGRQLIKLEIADFGKLESIKYELF